MKSRKIVVLIACLLSLTSIKVASAKNHKLLQSIPDNSKSQTTESTKSSDNLALKEPHPLKAHTSDPTSTYNSAISTASTADTSDVALSVSELSASDTDNTTPGSSSTGTISACTASADRRTDTASKASAKRSVTSVSNASAKRTTASNQTNSLAVSNQDWNSQHTGYATYTGSGYSGGCSLLDPIPSAMEITALNPTNYNSYGVKAALAGAYLQVKGPNGTTTVYVNDLYPEGTDGALDLCPASFKKIGNMSDGKINIQWSVVKAPITGNFSYRIKEGSNPWWTAIQVRNHKYPVLKLECYKDNQWISLEKTEWNHFVGSDLGSGSLKIRITDILGHVVTDTISLPKDSASSAYIVPGSVQFPD